MYSDAIILTYTPIGSGISKTTHFEIDGVEIGTTVIATTNRQQTYTIPAQTHGAHTLRIYMTAEIEGVSIKSNELYYEFIFAVSGQTAPIIASSFQNQTVTQYSTVSIPYYVYDPDTISIHCVVGQCSIEALGEIFAPTSRQASSNYGVGKDGRIGMYVEEKDRSSVVCKQGLPR